MEQLKKEIVDYVNANVNRFSRISEVVEEKDEFIKTPTQKIRRFLYSGKNTKDADGGRTSGGGAVRSEAGDPDRAS